MNTKESTNQNILTKLVVREIGINVTTLVNELSKHDEYLDTLVDIAGTQEEDGSYSEALEYWLVSDWFAEKLIAHGELVALDFLDLNIWGRTCSGQAIHMDKVIYDIGHSLKILFGQQQEWVYI